MNTAAKLPVAILLLMIGVTSCKSLNIKTGAVIGAAGGEAIGGVIGQASGNASAGAAIGANLGEVTGTVVAGKKDKQLADLKKAISTGSVDREGEHIIIEFNNKTLFKNNSPDLSMEGQKNLDELAKVFEKYPDSQLQIQGFSDNRGADNDNLSFSSKRADSVAAFLIKKGINNNRISSKGFGKTSPKYSNESARGRMQNRRIALVVNG